MAGKRRNIAAAIAQCGDRDRRRAEPLGKIAVEAVVERAAGAGDDPDVDRIRAIATDRAHFAGGEHAVELALGVDGQIADVVEQQGAAIGLDQSDRPVR